MDAPLPATRAATLALLLVWLLAAVYLASGLNRGWVPHDEGFLGHSAERVLRGELPHRDSYELYTGGLAYFDAAAFRLFGVNLMVLRWVLFAFFLLWVPAVFAIAREFFAPWPAAGVTLLSVAWSVPNFPAAMPSWYCLFFSTFGVCVLFRYLRRPNPWWLLLAGLCGGFSFLMKSPGLYYVAGVLLFLVFREQSLSRQSSYVAPASRSILYVAFLLLSLSLFLVILFRVAIPGGGPSEFLHFVFPSLAIVVFLLSRELAPAASANASRFRLLLSLCFPFLVGALLPPAIFGFLYWCAGALPQLIHGLFALPFRRLTGARLDPPHWIFSLVALPLVLFLLGKARRARFWTLTSAPKLLAAAALLLLTAHGSLTLLVLEVNSLRAATPILVSAALVILFLRRNEPATTLRHQQIMLLLSVTALCSLIQFPFAAPLYFCYFATLAFLTFGAVLSLSPQPHRFDLSLAGLFFALLAIFLFRPVTLAAFASEKSARLPDVPLALPRAGGLRVFQDQADLYQQLIPFLTRLCADAPVIAAPDCPEVYFLSGLHNPTPVFFEFFEQPTEYKDYLEQQLDRPNFIKVVVVNNDPGFSHVHLDILRALVIPRFPESRKFGRFEVFWRP